MDRFKIKNQEFIRFLSVLKNDVILLLNKCSVHFSNSVFQPESR